VGFNGEKFYNLNSSENFYQFEKSLQVANHVPGWSSLMQKKDFKNLMGLSL
jgi:hypothetical protein